MKKLIIVYWVIAIAATPLAAQKKLSFAAGYFGQNISTPGAVFEFEYEKFTNEELSFPLRADLLFFIDPEYKTVVFDVHKGFRKYFKSGLFLEQSVGVGLAASFYTLESIFYYDKYTSPVFYSDGANLGFMPSVTFGVGYNMTPNKGKHNLIWIRPKVYWNLGIRGLNLPYYALQVGYTYNFKSI